MRINFSTFLALRDRTFLDIKQDQSHSKKLCMRLFIKVFEEETLEQEAMDYILGLNLDQGFRIIFSTFQNCNVGHFWRYRPNRIMDHGIRIFFNFYILILWTSADVWALMNAILVYHQLSLHEISLYVYKGRHYIIYFAMLPLLWRIKIFITGLDVNAWPCASSFEDRMQADKYGLTGRRRRMFLREARYRETERAHRAAAAAIDLDHTNRVNADLRVMIVVQLRPYTRINRALTLLDAGRRSSVRPFIGWSGATHIPHSVPHRI